ncbi:phosphoribosylanthranilate isomerase [Fundidesulfovibrio soli]|uniref:phosphoribosylanthranilate isomerase n=1 Tax=Fundidesulfovibrio soli TaxID=2922716 RepID=UPI001FAFF708|nr:phosphoribosylanthranilate isomerase [Fundidesulfovibrio soli]
MIKVCGMTLPEQVAAIDALGADFLGFIFAAKSPRCVTPGHVASIARGRARRVGVFVEQSAAEVLSIMDEAGLDFAQLHAGQDEAFCREIGPERVIRAFWPQRHASLAELEAELARFADSCAMMLLDAGASGGGHGTSLDFSALAGLKVPRPWLLAGGLSPLNAQEALELARPAGLDINSGVETAPGVKDLDKVSQTIDIAARSK